VVGEVAARRALASGKMQVDGEVMVNGLDLGMITSRMDAEDMRRLAGGIDLSMLTSSMWPMIVLGFVVFFYCLGSLYDERKDRSVLFWKSLPVSDRDTVLSKVASAVLVAPALAVAAWIATMFAFLLLVSGFVLAHGGNPLTLLWGPGSPLANAGVMIASIPVYAVWALPTVGWLMLCSSWARSKPFLWAIMIPVMAGIFISWFDVMNAVDLDSGWFWRNVVARALGGVFPGTWIDVANTDVLQLKRPGDMIHQGALLKTMYSVLATPQAWIGAVAGVAMIAASIRMRRWRDEG
jgi:ABC-2 type transport system permease protein